MTRIWNRCGPKLEKSEHPCRARFYNGTGSLYESSQLAGATVWVMNASHRHENGEHDFWTHFWWGLILGGAVGGWVGWEIFDRGWPVFVAAVGAAIVAAYSAGRWGDRFWYSSSTDFGGFFETLASAE